MYSMEGYQTNKEQEICKCGKPARYISWHDDEWRCNECYDKAEKLYQRKETLRYSKELSEELGMSMAMVHQLVEERARMYDYIQDVAEINADRISSACFAYGGQAAYYVERVSDHRYRKRIVEIDAILHPNPPQIEAKKEVFEWDGIIRDEDLPF